MQIFYKCESKEKNYLEFCTKNDFIENIEDTTPSKNYIYANSIKNFTRGKFNDISSKIH